MCVLGEQLESSKSECERVREELTVTHSQLQASTNTKQTLIVSSIIGTANNTDKS